ncbi:PAS domain S-box-containing protein [Alteromonadaceae bacterium 2753L.S.0a.02]|nr:PAS domain S-box-containing protein [Alteromonadaceae bacterium 2753L.S.0a.02]
MTTHAAIPSSIHDTLLSALADLIPGSYIAVFDNAAKLCFVSESAASTSHVALNKNIGKYLPEIISLYGKQAQEVLNTAFNTVFSGAPCQVDVIDNTLIERFSLTPITDVNSQVENVLCVVQNLTNQKRSVDAQRENETHLKMASQLAKIGYWELDVETFIFTFNDEFIEILGVTVEELGGYQVPAQKYADDFLFEEDRPLLQSETQLAVDTDDPNFSRYIEHRFKNGKGEVGYLGVRYVVEKDANGKTIKTIGANQDITERKNAEQELQNLLKKTTDQNRRLKDFSFMTSHNIRSSVANLVGLSQLLKEEPGNSEYIEMLATTVSKLDNTVKNINTLLNYENVLESESKAQCNVQQALDRFIQLNATIIKKKAVHINSQIPEDYCVYCVPAYLDSVLHNLVSNAVKYGVNELSKVIDVGVVDSPGTGIYVKDYGDGLDLDTYGHKIFKPGSRFHTNIEGQGMGLYMTKNQIESCGGSIAIESNPGGGTTFTVCFGSN